MQTILTHHKGFAEKLVVLTRSVLLLFGSITLSRCAAINANSVTVNEMQSPPTAGATVEVYPLDQAKITSVEYITLKQNFEDDLSAEGFSVQKPFSTRSKYIFFIDYAYEIGIDQPWDRYSTAIAYDTTTGTRVFQDDLESDGPSNDIVRVAILLFRQTAKDFTSGEQGEHQIRILE